jgi:hypothetical protein
MLSPAELTSSVAVPNAASQAANRPATEASLPTSVCTAIARCASPMPAQTACAAASSLKYVMTTRAPASPNAFAQAAPIPDSPPVTMAIWSCNIA